MGTHYTMQFSPACRSKTPGFRLAAKTEPPLAHASALFAQRRWVFRGRRCTCARWRCVWSNSVHFGVIFSHREKMSVQNWPIALVEYARTATKSVAIRNVPKPALTHCACATGYPWLAVRYDQAKRIGHALRLLGRLLQGLLQRFRRGCQTILLSRFGLRHVVEGGVFLSQRVNSLLRAGFGQRCFAERRVMRHEFVSSFSQVALPSVVYRHGDIVGHGTALDSGCKMDN